MIRAELLNEVQALDRDDKLAIIRLLQEDIVDDSCAWDDLQPERGRVFKFIPPIRASAETIKSFDALARLANADD